jgi:hypothetical protein
MKHAATRELHAYWDRLRAGRAAPERSDLDPGAIKNLLGDVFLVEVVAAERYIIRLAGTRICALLGRELKGRNLGEAFAIDNPDELYELFDEVSSNTVPAVAGIMGETADHRRVDLELAVLPLRLRGRTHARLVGSLAALEVPYWVGAVPLASTRLVSTRLLQPEGEDGDGIAARGQLASGRLRVLPGGRP